jgi:hypothetical protein
LRRPIALANSARLADRARREVDAHEARARQRGRHRHEVAAVAASDLEDTRGRRIRRVVPEQRGDRRHVRRMAVAARPSDIQVSVVGGP